MDKQIDDVAADILRLAHNTEKHTAASLKQHLFVIHKDLEQANLKASGVEHIAGLVASIRKAQAANYTIDENRNYGVIRPPALALKSVYKILDDALQALPPELRGK